MKLMSHSGTCTRTVCVDPHRTIQFKQFFSLWIFNGLL